MTQPQAPYDAGQHPGFHKLARCDDWQIGQWNGSIYLLRDDDSRERVRDLKAPELEAVVLGLARLVGGLRDDIVELGKLGEERKDDEDRMGKRSRNRNTRQNLESYNRLYQS